MVDMMDQVTQFAFDVNMISTEVAFVDYVMDEMQDLIGCDSAVFLPHSGSDCYLDSAIGPIVQSNEYQAYRGLSTDGLDPLLVWARSDNILKDRGVTTMRVEACRGILPHKKLKEAFLKPLSINDCLAVVLCDVNGLIGSFAFYNMRNRGRFDRDHQRLARLVGPVMSANYQRIKQNDDAMMISQLMGHMRDLIGKDVILFDKDMKINFGVQSYKGAEKALDDAICKVVKPYVVEIMTKVPWVDGGKPITIPGIGRLEAVWIRNQNMGLEPLFSLSFDNGHGGKISGVTNLRRRGLTERQAEISIQICAGLTNNQIAAKLSISKKTVENHIQAILERLQVNNRVMIVNEVYGSGVCQPRSWNM